MINQIKTTHLQGKFPGQLLAGASLGACWNSLLFQLQGPTAETPRKAQTSPAPSPSCSGFAAVAAKTLMIQLSFVPGSSLDNKWEQYFIYAQVINSKAEEAADKRRAVSMKKVMD